MSPFTNKNLKKIGDLTQALMEARKIVVLTGARPDSIFAAAGMKAWLASLGRQVQIVGAGFSEDDFFRAKESGVDLTGGVSFRTLKIDARNTSIEFAPLDAFVQNKEAEFRVLGEADDSVLRDLKVSIHNSEPDLAFLLGEKELFERVHFSESVVKVNISRAFTASGHSHIEFFNPTASSTSEIVSELLFRLGADLSPEAATFLYAGLSVASGNFQSPQVTGSTFEIGAWLLENGADQEKAVGYVFPRLPLKTLKFFGTLLDQFKMVPGLPATVVVVKDDTNLTHYDLGQTLWNIQNWLGANIQANLLVSTNDGVFQVAASTDELLDEQVLQSELQARNFTLEHHGPLSVVFFEFDCGMETVEEVYTRALSRAFGML